MKIGIVSGYWNPIGYHHIKYINDAASRCDKLFVIVNNDVQVKIKGSCPFQSQYERLEIVQNIKGVHIAFIACDVDSSISQSIEAIYLSCIKDYSEQIALGFESELLFAFYKGGDRRPDSVGLPQKELDICKKLGINIVYGVGGNEKTGASSDTLLDCYLWYSRKT